MRANQHLAQLSAVAASLSPLVAAIVTVDPTPRQTLTSFGASGAWWPTDISFFPEKSQDELAHFLFSEDGIYLSSYRYNMGADSGNVSKEVSGFDRQVQCFLTSDGTYDFSRDKPGVKFMQYAHQYNVSSLTFFINAAPSHIAGNNAACGWTFTDDKIPAYSSYIQTVLSYWIEQGIDIDFISPMNEPDYNHLDCGQEGMFVFDTDRTLIFQGISEALKNTTASSVGIIGDETSQLGEASFSYNLWLPDSAQYLAHIAVHNYDYPTDQQVINYYNEVQFLTALKNNTPTIKFTEACCSTGPGHGPLLFGAQYDPTMVNALIDARYVWQYMTYAHVVSFDWWSAVSGLPCSPSIDGAQCYTAFNASNGYNSALVYIDDNYNQTHDYNFYYTKRTWMMKHYAYFHRPGSVRYDVPQAQLPDTTNIFASKLDSVWSVFFMNHANATQNLTFVPPESGATLSRAVLTDPFVDWEDDTDAIAQTAAANGSLLLQLPAMSFLTLQFAS